MILWMGVLLGVLILVSVSIMLQTKNVFTGPVVQNVSMFQNISFVIIIVALMVIVVLKRRFLDRKRIVAQAKKLNYDIQNQNIKALFNASDVDGKELARIIMVIQRYYLSFWLLAEFVALVGFLFFILTSQFQTFIIYVVISIWSLVVNFPRVGQLERYYHYLNNP